jgi:hypothetical protein
MRDHRSDQQRFIGSTLDESRIENSSVLIHVGRILFGSTGMNTPRRTFIETTRQRLED